MAFDVRQTDLKKLNSLTKYPSILTFHQLDPSNGGLIEEPTLFRGPAIATEKVDGTNARIIVLPDRSFLIGSREELLYARGDLIGNPALGIVEALRERAEALADAAFSPDVIVVFYGEVFGGKVTGASKQYTGERQVGFRLFDVARIAEYDALMAMPPQDLAIWREQGGQPFVAEDALCQLAEAHGFDLTPRLFTLEPDEVPRTIDDAHALLTSRLPRTLCLLDEQGGGQPEGIVLRTPDRSQIAKLRFEDYQRTLKRRGKK